MRRINAGKQLLVLHSDNSALMKTAPFAAHLYELEITNPSRANHGSLTTTPIIIAVLGAEVQFAAARKWLCCP